MIRVYAAGKIRPGDWRSGIAGLNMPEGWATSPDEVPLGNGLVYVGPWFIACDHGCYHGEGTHGAATLEHVSACAEPGPSRRMVLERSLSQIRRADVIYVRLDAPDCYGTLTEIGYAAALGKTFVVDASASAPLGDMWFPQMLAALSRPAPSTVAAVRRVFST